MCTYINRRHLTETTCLHRVALRFYRRTYYIIILDLYSYKALYLDIKTEELLIYLPNYTYIFTLHYIMLGLADSTLAG